MKWNIIKRIICLRISGGKSYIMYQPGDIPVKDFLDKSRPSVKAKAFRIFLNITQYGLSALIPHVKKLSGTPLWEIRILGEDNIRILYIMKYRNTLLLLHAFQKKKQKTPKKEINIALARMREYEKC